MLLGLVNPLTHSGPVLASSSFLRQELETISACFC